MDSSNGGASRQANYQLSLAHTHRLSKAKIRENSYQLISPASHKVGGFSTTVEQRAANGNSLVCKKKLSRAFSLQLTPDRIFLSRPELAK